MRHIPLLLTAFAALLWPAADAAAAGKVLKSVTACSAWGNGCIVAPVRRGRWGLEARLRSGRWLDCRGDCRETIRQEVLDFWETQNDKALLIR